jgi:putative RecB family exonuclease
MIAADLQLPTRHAPSGLLDYVSPSRLNLWLKCPLAFQLKYVEGLRTPTSPAQLVGKTVHRALERYYRRRQLSMECDPAQIIAALPGDWESLQAEDPVSFEDRAQEQAMHLQARSLVETYLAQIPCDESRPLAVETEIQVPLVDPHNGEDLGIPFLGIVDLILDEPSGPRIIDFKTASRGGQAVEILHEVQLTAYSYLFRQASSATEGALEIRQLIKTKIPRLERQTFEARTPRHFSRLFGWIRAYLDDLDRGRFLPRPGLTCAGCEHRLTRCQAWQPS